MAEPDDDGGVADMATPASIATGDAAAAAVFLFNAVADPFGPRFRDEDLLGVDALVGVTGAEDEVNSLAARVGVRGAAKSPFDMGEP